MSELEQLRKEWQVEAARLRAGLGKPAAPGRLLSELQGIPFVAGEQVVDLVTGKPGVVIGTGIRNV